MLGIPYTKPTDVGVYGANSALILESPPNATPLPPWVWDPDTDVIDIARLFDTLFFNDTLGCVPVIWSNRLTSAAGNCRYRGRNDVEIRLSVKLLQFRGREDLMSTLAHEMIHAFLFLDQNVSNHENHGDIFQAHMMRINAMSGLKISVYHSFMDEVDHYKTHWWKCTGRCGKIVKRATNRKPGKYDGPSWYTHKASCGAPFVKIKEPEEYTRKQEAKRKRAQERAERAEHKAESSGSAGKRAKLLGGRRINEYFTSGAGETGKGSGDERKGG